jgi:H+-transporting ATPase
VSPNTETAQQKPVPEKKSKSDAKAQAKVDLKPGAKSNSKDDLKSVPMAELQTKLGSTPEGLSQDEAQKRLTQYGPNEIPEKKTNLFLKFLSYFWGPIPWMIEGAVILSGVVKHWLDFFIILFLLFSNAVVAFWEERQAGNAIAALKATLATKATAKRDGKWATPKASELVPGDVVRLRLGDIVPADARLLTGDPVQVDQSALTGESLPATRKPGEAVFSGSIIRRGEIDAMVYATGANTYFGKTVQLVEEAHTVSHFQKAVLKIGRRRTFAGEKTSGRHTIIGDRGIGWRRHPVLRQNRHFDPKQAHIGRPIHGEQHCRRPGGSVGRPRFTRGRQGHHRPGCDRRGEGR